MFKDILKESFSVSEDKTVSLSTKGINKAITDEQIQTFIIQIYELTKIEFPEGFVKELYNTNRNWVIDFETNHTALPIILEKYDNYRMSNLNEENQQMQKIMEQYATSEFDGNTVNGDVYYKTDSAYYVWNLKHMTQHPERHNHISEAAYCLENCVVSSYVDTRKDYGEVRYVVDCRNRDGTYEAIICYRYDKTHIRIITVYKNY